MKHLLSLLALAALTAAAFWPAPRVDVSPLFERPERPQHPSSVYTPKALR